MQARKIVNPFKILFLFNTLLLLLAFSASSTFANFYVIAGSRGVGTKINSLPATISSSGFYFIDKDLSCIVTDQHGITITADNVTLDLMEFSLIGPGGSSTFDGIYMNTRTNVEIRNGTIRNFARYGIFEGNTAGIGHRIINIRVKDNQSTGICLWGKGNLVEKCTAVDNNENGIYTGYGSTVIGNTCYSNTGFGLYFGGNSFVDQNTAYDNTEGQIRSCGTCVFGTNLPDL